MHALERKVNKVVKGLDLCFLVDCTGSMVCRPPILSVQNSNIVLNSKASRLAYMPALRTFNHAVAAVQTINGT